MFRFTRYVFPGIVTLSVVMGGYFWLREEVTTRIYRNKLEALAHEYLVLSDQYNEAVRQSAVTELEVTEDSIAVIVRTADGQIRKQMTPYNPAREIYVDYLVGNGRIWIRRVFDSSTPPDEATLIDPVWETVQWDTASLDYGKAIYRSLQPGIWSIQVSGNGALSLEKVDRSLAATLEAAPEIRSYEEIRMEIEQDVKEIGPADLWGFITGNPR